MADDKYDIGTGFIEATRYAPKHQDLISGMNYADICKIPRLDWDFSTISGERLWITWSIQTFPYTKMD